MVKDGLTCHARDDGFKPIQINDVLHIGNQVTHAAHVSYMFKCRVYYHKCGFDAGEKQLVYLAQPCVPSTDGHKIVNDIESGSLSFNFWLLHYPCVLPDI